MPNWSESRRSGQLSRGIGVSAGQGSQHQDLCLAGSRERDVGGEGGQSRGGEDPAQGREDDEVHDQQGAQRQQREGAVEGGIGKFIDIS